MTEAERRAANRIRIAAGVGDDPTPPGYTGAEILFWNALTSCSSSRGHTEFEGGWRARETELNFTPREER